MQNHNEDKQPADRELLELAAKAAGIDAEWIDYDLEGMWLKGERSPDNSKYWNPLTDDGDALRLAVKTGIFTTSEQFRAFQMFYSDEIHRDNRPTEATRRAIVFIAAEIGRQVSRPNEIGEE